MLVTIQHRHGRAEGSASASGSMNWPPASVARRARRGGLCKS